MSISILFFLHLSVFAELINGPANIRKGPKDEIILTLNDSVYVDCKPENDGWFYLVFSCTLTKTDFEQQKSISKGDILYNLENKPIGIALKDISFNELGAYELHPFKMDTLIYGFDLYGVTFKTNIYSSSIVENLINQLLSEKGQLKYDRMKDQLTNFKFDSCRYVSEFYPQLKEFALMNYFYPDGRVRLIFENEILIAIVFHDNINTKETDIYKLDDFYNMAILKCPSGISIADFVANNIKSYYGKN